MFPLPLRNPHILYWCAPIATPSGDFLSFASAGATTLHVDSTLATPYTSSGHVAVTCHTQLHSAVAISANVLEVALLSPAAFKNGTAAAALVSVLAGAGCTAVLDVRVGGTAAELDMCELSADGLLLIVTLADEEIAFDGR